MGRIFRYDADVDTDQIIASQYLLYPTIGEMKEHTFESLDPRFMQEVKEGDFIVAAHNFGCGSSREQAPAVLKAVGIKAVLAKSYARIFYRNAINIGLPVIICDDLYENVKDGDEMSLDLSSGTVTAGGRTFSCTKLPPKMQEILDDGGLIASLDRLDPEADDPAPARESRTAEAPAGGSLPKRGMTMAEKIIARAAGKDEVHAGEIHVVTLDKMMSNDGTTHLTIDMYRNLRHPRIADKEKLVWIVDHNVPCDSVKTAASQKKMRDFAKEEGLPYFHEGDGICHQLMIEKYICPGELAFGADSHTCAYGALGAFGTGVGCTDYLYSMVTGTSWVMVPETLRFVLNGKLPEKSTARDLILTIIGMIGANGANYKCMEFVGEGMKTLTMGDRISICNLCVEAGAKTALMEADEIALKYLEEHGRQPKACFTSDPDAKFEKVYEIDLGSIEPVVAKPHFVDSIAKVSECRGIRIDEAFLGSCNNGRYEDLKKAAELIKGKKVADHVRFLVVPASREEYIKALEDGVLDIFMKAGAIVMNPNCSVCWGSCQGVIGEGEVLISTGTRNFKGRAGHKGSFVYLADALTVTASAVAGEITEA